MFALSFTTLAFNSVQGGQSFFGIVVGLLLGILGIVGSFAFETFKRVPPSQEVLNPRSEESVNLFTLLFVVYIITVSLFFAFSYLVPQLTFSGQNVSYQTFYGQFSFNLQSSVPLSVPGWIPAFLFIAVLIPNVEEQFFRGFWGNLALVSFPSEGLAAIFGGFLGQLAGLAVAAILGGAIFGVFHTPAYNGNMLVIIVLSLDGAVVIGLNSIVGRLDNGIMAHMTNNALAFALSQSSVLNLIPGIGPSPIHLIAPFLGPMIILAIVLYKRRAVICR